MDTQVWYTSGYKYQLQRDYTTYTDIHLEKDIVAEYISLTTEGELTVRKGYAWDGPSGPTVDDTSNIRASVGHDAKYQLMRLQLIPPTYRKLSDRELREELREDGMGWFRRQQWYYGLRIGGSSSALPKSRKIVRVAPERS